jgi:hypothetical protein
MYLARVRVDFDAAKSPKLFFVPIDHSIDTLNIQGNHLCAREQLNLASPLLQSLHSLDI